MKVIVHSHISLSAREINSGVAIMRCHDEPKHFNRAAERKFEPWDWHELWAPFAVVPPKRSLLGYGPQS